MTTNNSESTPEFDDFVASGEVETGATESTEEKKPESRRNPPKPAVEKEPAASEDEDETDTSEDEEGNETDTSEDEENGGDDKKKPSAKESQINRLKREKAELARKLREAEASKAAELAGRLENLETSCKVEKLVLNPTPESRSRILPTPTNIHSGTSTTVISRISLNGCPRKRQPSEPMRSRNVSRKASESRLPNSSTGNCSSRSMTSPRAAPISTMTSRKA